MKTFKIGEKVKVFDNLAWSKTGDIGDNSQFLKKAIIIKLYVKKSIYNGYCYFDKLADVLFDDGNISAGHYQDGIEKI